MTSQTHSLSYFLLNKSVANRIARWKDGDAALPIGLQNIKNTPFLIILRPISALEEKIACPSDICNFRQRSFIFFIWFIGVTRGGDRGPGPPQSNFYQTVQMGL